MKRARRRALARAIAWSWLPCACLPAPRVDLDGPRVVDSTLAANGVEIPVWPTLTIELSEPLDPASVHRGSVALVAWELLDERCDLSPVCSEGRCTRGRCQAPSLSAGDRSALDRGELDPAAPQLVPIELTLLEGDAGPDARLVVRPQRPLDVHRRHSLVLGAGLRDRSGAPLVDEYDRAVAWTREFVTGGVGSAGPEPRLVSPAPGQRGVATNLAWVETQLWPPVPVPQAAATLTLEPDDEGPGVELVDPRDCPGWIPGTCLRWQPASSLRAGVRYRPAGGSLVDRLARAAVRPGFSRETWFAAGPGSDDAAPAATATARIDGRCLVVWVDAGETVEARLRVDADERRASIDRRGWLGIELDAALEPGAIVSWALALDDFAANTTTLEGALELGPSVDPGLARVRISEVLANPAGAEPDAEFVELLAGPEGAQLGGLVLADVGITELHAAWLAGDTPGGDPLPDVTLGPGELAIVVGQGWVAGGDDGDDADPPPPPGTQILRVDASIGHSGLKNAGEPLTLWTASEQGPVVVASYGNWLETGASSHDGRSVVSGPDACDLPDRWRSHPHGRSTPGTAP